ncbi:MAG: AAA-like domain-containing protein [Eubacteriales bacterium]|nr:AAA-like domain-containing protein [Eubacteriales bacterium]
MKTFNTTAVCIPDRHYMVDLTTRLDAIKAMVDDGKYFTINRARQYGKTTTLKALEKYLAPDYIVISLDFQNLDHDTFETGGTFSQALARLLMDASEFKNIPIPEEFLGSFQKLDERNPDTVKMDELFRIFRRWCKSSHKPIVLLIDEVDSAANNQVFLDFLSQLRAGYIDRDTIPTFHSVILAGVTDVKNLKRKLRPEESHKLNSPWNIAADFNIDMSFSAEDIKGMLKSYEADHHTGMDIDKIARLIYDYTDGYPFLVSRMCQYLGEKMPGTARFQTKAASWTSDGVNEAARLIEGESNTLFESMIGKLYDYPELESIIRRILFNGEDIPYNPLEPSISQAVMYGFVKEKNGKLTVSNRIFETVFYNLFLTSQEMQKTEIWKAANREKYQFIENNQLNMERILERFVVTYNDIYGDKGEKFTEEEGRKYFLLYLKPIINGTGNYYIEARTRNNERTDIIVDYLGTQYGIELKIWHGNKSGI